VDEADFLENVEEVVDSWEEDFRDIITRRKSFLALLRPGLIVATLPAKHSCCRKGGCIEASLLCGETRQGSQVYIRQPDLLYPASVLTLGGTRVVRKVLMFACPPICRVPWCRGRAYGTTVVGRWVWGGTCRDEE